MVIPQAGRQQAFKRFHDGHPGVSRMKSLARSYIWWPGLDADIEAKVKNCFLCQQNQNSPLPSPLISWEFPEKPWQTFHADFPGPYKRKKLVPMTTMTSKKTIEVLRTIFSTHGLPEAFMSNNGPQFTSVEFHKFMNNNSIRHVCSVLYHTAMNGLAEQAVQTLKRNMEK